VSLRARSLADLPIYADDLLIGAAVLGKSRAREWRELAPLLETKGLPKIDRLHGGRYVPAVRLFYDNFNGIAPLAPAAPDGLEDAGAWKTRESRRRG
jgi:hypothetical protein